MTTSSINSLLAARAIVQRVSPHLRFESNRGKSHASAVAGLLKRRKADLVSLLPSCLCLAGVAVCTWLSFRFGQSFALPGFLYLVFVVVAAMYGGFWQATLISIAAVGCLNYYFVPPIFSFENSPANWVALGGFEFTALVISRLSLRAQLRAAEAIAERRDMERLYQTSRRILLLDSSSEPENLIAALIREIFELQGVVLFDAQSGATYQTGDMPSAVHQRIRDVFVMGAGSFDPKARSWYCVLRLGTRPLGVLALIETELPELAATALASLCAIALERIRALQSEVRAQAARQTEQLRTAVLDAMAHEFKTPVTVARTASSGLLAVGGLSELQTELITVIDRQARKLDDISSRLLTAARLDSTEFRPQCEALFWTHLMSAAIQKLESGSDRERFHVSFPPGERPVFADRELIMISIAQLLDNALKYSEPGSPIEIKFSVTETDAVLTMTSKGLVVAPADRERIFDRFYRAPDTHHMPAGTGLGLSVIKKIVNAHHGHVWAEGEAHFGTSFSISLPTAPIR